MNTLQDTESAKRKHQSTSSTCLESLGKCSIMNIRMLQMDNDEDGDSHIPTKSFRMGTSTSFEENSCQMRIDNSDNVLKTMRKLYYDRQMCDVYLTVGKKEHAAHRLILCASSDVFQAMLMKPEWSEWHESKIVLQELPQCENVFHLFLEYLYTGKLIITHINVSAILALADKYIVKSLTRLCVEYMCKHIAHAAFHNQLFSWLQYTINCGHSAVAELSQNYIKWNLESVANTPDFSNFEVDVFCHLLQQSDIVIYNEMVLYNCAARWLELQQIRLHDLGLPNLEIERHMRNMVEQVIQCIRFPMMSPRELADLLLSPLIKQYKDLFLDHMAIGMMYHSGKEDQVRNICSTKEGSMLFTPRLYTSDSFNTALLIENVPSLPSYHTCTFVFSTHMSAAEYESDKISEWVVDFYPKGVWFKKCFLIVWQGTLEVPEEVKSTVRLSLTCREPIEDDIRVRVGVLLYGVQGCTEHVMQVYEKIHHFNSQERIMVIDNLIPFEELNLPACATEKFTSSYLIGEGRNQLKMNVVITPLPSL